MALAVLLCLINMSCKQLVEIHNPSNSITSQQTFNSVASATSAVTAIYNSIRGGRSAGLSYGCGAITVYTGLSGDELISPTSAFWQNNLVPDIPEVLGFFWEPAYFDIYSANAAIEGLQASTLNPRIKDQLLGEAKFLRAYIYFNLVNLFGDVPLVITSAYNENALIKKSPASAVYKQIIQDLKDAEGVLPDDYSQWSGERTRATKWAAAALLARTYLYQGDWDNAIAQASLVIGNTNTFLLEPDLNSVFLKTSSEAILQWESVNSANFQFATQEGNFFIPTDATTQPSTPITPELINAFEPTDNRRLKWIDSSQSGADVWYYPFKLKVRETTPGTINEYLTPLRLAEQYLIRAESYAQKQDITSATSDLNSIRNRAGLLNYNGSTEKDSVLSAIAHERQVEMFAEFGHRWFDLKRTGKANSILSIVKGSNWQITDQLYPIPYSEILVDPNLTQNSGY